MKKVFVTGANSLLGTNIIIELLEQGYLVIGLLRNKKSFHYKKHPNLTLIEGELADTQALKKHLTDCTYLIHIAAITQQNLLRYSDYEKINVLATETLIKLAIQTKVSRFIFISSANAFGHGSVENPGNEMLAPRFPFTKSLYAKSKIRAQERVLSYKNQIDVVVINPSFMLGAYDSKPSSGKIIFMGYRKKWLFYPPGGKNFVHVKDVAKGTVSALSKGKNGEAYLLTGKNLSYKAFFEKLSLQTQNKPIYIQTPKAALLFVGYLGNILRFLRFKSSISKTNMQILCAHNFYSNLKAKEELAVSFHSTEEAISEAVNWFVENKQLKPFK